MVGNRSCCLTLLKPHLCLIFFLCSGIAAGGESDLYTVKGLDVLKAESWGQTLEQMDATGIPKEWTFLGPIPDSRFKLFYDKKGLDPDRIDDWSKPLKSPKGKRIRKEKWVQPEEDIDEFVDLTERLDPDEKVLAYARTEIAWPVEGPAIIWIQTWGRSVGFLNNKVVFTQRPGRNQSICSYQATVVWMKKGQNVFKLKTGQDLGAWGFKFRIQRIDSVYRIEWLKRLLQWFPNKADLEQGWNARLEMARHYERMANPKEALAIYDSVLKRTRRHPELDQTAREGKRRLGLKKKPTINARQVRKNWHAFQARFQGELDRGNNDAVDELLAAFIAKDPHMEWAGFALIERGRIRRQVGLARSSRAFFERALLEYPHHSNVVASAQGNLNVINNFRTDRLMFRRSTDQQATLKMIERQMRTGQANRIREAFRSLQHILRFQGDSLIRIQNYPLNPRYVGIQMQIKLFLVGLSPDEKIKYQEAVVGASQRAFQEALQTNDSAQWESIARVYPFTPVAAKALNRWGNVLMDRGAYAQAAITFQELLGAYGDTKVFSKAVVIAKLGAALLFLDDLQQARSLVGALEKCAGEKITVRGRTVTAAKYAAELKKQISQRAGSAARGGASENTFAGSLQRDGGAAKVADPLVPGPVVWTQPLDRSPSWDRAQDRHSPSPHIAFTSFPVVAGDRVFVTTLESARCFELKTGKDLWRQHWRSEGVLNPALGTAYPVSCPTVKSGRLIMRALEQDRSDIRCFDADKGTLLWRSTALAGFQKTVWLSDPVLAYGMAIAVYLEPGDSNTHGLAALDCKSGALRWKRPLVGGNTGIKENHSYHSTSAHLGPPAVQNGTVYTSTGACSVAALNVFDGSVQWITGYPRLRLSLGWNPNERLMKQRRMRYVKWFSRGPVAPVLAKDVVIIASKDGSGLSGYGRSTGVLQWRLPLNENRFLVGLSGDLVISVGRELEARGVKDGAQAWHLALPKGRLVGRPGYRGGRVYLPGQDGLTVVNAGDGKIIEQHAWDARVGPIGNLLATSSGLAGVQLDALVFLGRKGGAAGKSNALSLLDARNHVAAGRVKEARTAFGQVLASGTLIQKVTADIKRARLVGAKGKASKRDPQLLKHVKANPTTPIQGWQINRKIWEASFKKVPGKKGASATNKAKDGPLIFAWELLGKEARVFPSPSGRTDRFFAFVGGALYWLESTEKLKVLWKTYVGPNMSGLVANVDTLVIHGSKRFVTVDRLTGVKLWERFIPGEHGGWIRGKASHIGSVAVGKDAVAIQAGVGLYVYDLQSGAPLWINARARRDSLGLSFIDGRLNEIVNDRRNTYYAAFEGRSGKEIGKRKLLWKGTGKWPGSMLMPGGRQFVFRPGDRHVVMIDMTNGAVVWKQSDVKLVNALEYRHRVGLKFVGGLIHYYGHHVFANHQSYFLDPKTGKKIYETPKKLSWLAGEKTVLSTVYGRVYRHEFIKGKLKEWWSYPIIRLGGCHVYSCLRIGDSVVVSYYLGGDWLGRHRRHAWRVLDYETGQLIEERKFNGVPSNPPGGPVRMIGNLALIVTRNGLFAYAPRATSRRSLSQALTQSLGQKNVATDERNRMRKVVSELATDVQVVFRAPTDLVIDGNLTEWAGLTSIALDSDKHFVPLNSTANWKGKNDCSATVFVGWNHDGISLAVNVQDDQLVATPSGSLQKIGDALQLAFYSNAKKSLFCTMALVGGQSVVYLDRPSEVVPTGRVKRALDGSGLHYELFVPWSLLRKGGQSSGALPSLRLGVMVYDDDGAGVTKALEWGAGLAVAPRLVRRMPRISLMDISDEKIRQYREVIARLPDDPKSLRYLELILASKLGAKAISERAQECIDFLKHHPGGKHAFNVMMKLYNLNRQLFPKTYQVKTLAAAKAAKCPKHLSAVLVGGSAFRCWVYLDPKHSPSRIAIYFSTKKGWVRRAAYWGTAHGYWGRHPVQRVSMGPVPPAGKWVQLDIHPGELGLSHEDILGFVLMTHGGRVYFDRATFNNGTKETVLIDDALTKKIRRRSRYMKFVKEPHRFGKLSWVPTRWNGFQELPFEHAGTWFKFGGPSKGKVKVSPPPKDLAKRYLEAAERLADMQDAWYFLEKHVGCFPKADRAKARIKVCETFLKNHPRTAVAVTILSRLHEWYAKGGDTRPVVRCEKLMSDAKLRKVVRQRFYTRFAPSWQTWHFLGPVRNEEPGAGGLVNPARDVDVDRAYDGGNGQELSWKKLSDLKGTVSGKGRVDLFKAVLASLKKPDKKALAESDYTCYAYMSFPVPYKRKVLFFFGSNHRISIWCNGRQVVSGRLPGAQKDAESISVSLPKGEATLLIRVDGSGDRNGFNFRISDESGRPYSDLAKP